MNYKLSQGLQVSFLILSPSHTKSLLQRKSSKKMGQKKYNELTEQYGFSAKLLRRKRSLFQIDSAFLEANNPFYYKSCLVVAFTVGYFYNKSQENDQNKAIFDRFHLLHSKDEDKRKKICKYILGKCSELLSQVNFSIKGPHSRQHLIELCNQYNVQIWAFSSIIRGKCHLQYPENFDPTRMPIFLYFSETEDDLIHVDTILNLPAFFTKSQPCLQCLSFRSRLRFHRCKQKKRPYCKFCNRILLQDGDYCNQALEKMYCSSRVNRGENAMCPYCSKTIRNLKCLQYHKSICKRYKTCSKCHKKTLKNNHQCNTKQCLLCFENYKSSAVGTAATTAGASAAATAEEEHICNIQVPTPTKIFPRLAFFDCETRIEQQNDYANLIPNIVITAYESSYHEDFSLVTFCEEGLHLEVDGKIIPKVLNIPYLPSYYNRRIMSQKLSSFYKGRNFEKEGPALELTNDNNELWIYQIPWRVDLKDNCMYKFLRFFLRSYFRNTVFIAHRGSRFDALPLIAILLKFPSLQINVIHSGNAALCVEIMSLNIRFIDFYRYCPSALDSLCSQFDLQIKKSYFPYKFITKDHHNYIGNIPDFEQYWYESFDSSKKLQDKKEFWAQEAAKNKSQWNFNRELYEYCKLDVFCLTQIGTL